MHPDTDINIDGAQADPKYVSDIVLDTTIRTQTRSTKAL